MPVLSESERSSLTIRRLIFHTVGGGAADPALHNEPPRRDETDEFFLERIREHADGIMFDLRQGTPVLNAVRSMLRDETRFVRESKRLARQFHSTRAHMRASLFMVFLLDFEDKSCVALLKYDQQTVVRARVGARGKKTALAAVNDALVREKPAVEKAAIVRLSDTRDGEAAVHDRSDRALITSYFKEYLHANRRHTLESLTGSVFEIFNTVAAKHRDAVPELNRDGLNRRIAETLRECGTFDPAAPDLVIGQVFGVLPSDSPIPGAIYDEFERYQITTEPFVIQRDMIARPPSRRVLTREGVRVHYTAALEDHVEISEDRLSVTITSNSPVQVDDEPRGTNRGTPPRAS